MTKHIEDYGGRILDAITSTGVSVTNYAAPVRLQLRDDDDLSFNFNFDRWEDTSDFEDDKTPIAAFAVTLNSRNFDLAKVKTDYAQLLAAIKSGVLTFLGLDPASFKFISITVDSMNLSIHVQARHKTRNSFRLEDMVEGSEKFNEVKVQYLDTIVRPLLGMAWDLAQTDRNLSKFKSL